MLDIVLPLGFITAAADWDDALAGRPMTVADWHQLTFGEQQRYGAAECKTKGAVYKTRISGQEIEIKVILPLTLLQEEFSPAEAKWLERNLHVQLEETIHWILTRRQQGRT